MTDMTMPPLIHAVGLACVPVPDMPGGEPALIRRPVAAAIVTLARRDDGHREIGVARHCDARAAEFPLPWLVDRSLAPRAPVIITPADAATLAVDAAERQFASEPRLAALAGGAGLVDPRAIAGLNVGDETALYERLGIPLPPTGDDQIAEAWSRHRTDRAMTAALGIAVARLIVWACAQAFRSAAPEPLFDTLLPLHGWLLGEIDRMPYLDPLLRSRPIRRAASLASHYRAYCERRDAGDAAAVWTTFEDGFFHI